MKSWGALAGLAMLIGTMSGCGGGGGGGGGGGFPIVPVAAMTVSVSVNGTLASADSAGQYAVEPGDTVEITPSMAAEWSSSASETGAITLRNPAITANKWSARLVSTSGAQVTYTVSAKGSTNAALTKDTVLKVAPADTRNGEYKVWATNGTQQKLALNFDTTTYEMTDAAGIVTSDGFSADPGDAGTWIFKNSKITSAANTARFRVTDEAVVGSFPFEAPQVPATYVVQPFVASRSLVTAQAELDGAYNRLGVNYNATTRDSQIRQVEVSGGGTVFKQCSEVAIYAVANCPAASTMTYAVSAGTTAGSWNYVNIANAEDRAAFTVALVGGQKVMLASGLSQTGSDRVFRIGVLDDAAWPTNVARGGDTHGAWGTLALADPNGTGSLLRPDGGTESISYSFTPLGGVVAPPGLRSSGASPNAYFAVRNSKLSVVVGARGNHGGYMHFGLID